MERMKHIRDCLLDLAVEQFEHPECVDTHEMKAVIKMVKYLTESIHYYMETEVLEEKYHMGDWEEHESSHMKQYMEATDAQTKMKCLENYLTEIHGEMGKMLAHATPEEKQLMQRKISSLSTKIV